VELARRRGCGAGELAPRVVSGSLGQSSDATKCSSPAGSGEGAAVGAEEFSEFGDDGAFADVGGGEVLDLGGQVILVERESSMR
jgi:hypothetical protein